MNDVNEYVPKKKKKKVFISLQISAGNTVLFTFPTWNVIVLHTRPVGFASPGLTKSI